MEHEHDPSPEADLVPEIDLDQTDRLPILADVLYEVDIDIEDDAVLLDRAAPSTDHTVPLNRHRPPPNLTGVPRGASLDARPPAQGARSADEEGSARQVQGTEYDALNPAVAP